MLGTIEELEKDIEQFQHNIAASEELQMLLRQILEQIKKQNLEFDAQSLALISKMDNLPATIENENVASNNSIKNDVAVEIDRVLQSFAKEQSKYLQALGSTKKDIDKVLMERSVAFSDEQGKYMASLQQTQNELKNSEQLITVKYAEFMEQLQELNISDLHEQNMQIKNEINKRLLILTIVSLISIVVGIVGIII